MNPRQHLRRSFPGRPPRLAGPAALVRLAARCTAEQLEWRTLLSTVAVTTTADVSDVNPAAITVSLLANPAANPDGKVSLREAVWAARNAAGADTVNVPAGTYSLNGTVLEVDAPAAGGALTIRGTGAAGSAVLDARHLSAVALVNGPASVTLVGLTLKNGDDTDQGAGIYNAGNLTLDHCTLSGNRAIGADGTGGGGDGAPGMGARGGGIFNMGTLALVGCTVAGNSAVAGRGGDTGLDGGGQGGQGGSAFGGGIVSAGALTMTDTTLSNNAATGGAGGGGMTHDSLGGNGGDAGGGGLFVDGPTVATLTRCTVSTNRAQVGAGGTGFADFGTAGTASGGGVYNANGAALTLASCTVDANTASADTTADNTGNPEGALYDDATDARGGGVYNAGVLTAAGGAISHNAATGGAGAGDDNHGGSGGNGLGGGLYNADAASAAFTGVAFVGNLADGGDGGMGLFAYDIGVPGEGRGAGVYNLRDLTLDGCTLSGNTADTDGGGAFSNGTLTVRDTTIDGNAAARGAGAANYGAMTATGTTISNNVATGITGRNGTPAYGLDGYPGLEGTGGGVYTTNTAAFANCTIANNRAVGGRGGDGWDVDYDGTGGTGGNGVGGGIANDAGTVALVNCTVAGNAATGGPGGIGGPGAAAGGVGQGLTGGVYNGDYGGTVRLSNTIVAGNTAATRNPDVRGTFVSGPGGAGGANLVGNVGDAVGFTPADPIGGGGSPVVDAKLGALAANGGPTKTMALLAGSPALGAGKNGLAVGPDAKPLATDQRGAGYVRVVGTSVDMGAFEDQGTTARIAGAFFYDLDHDGARDAGEPPLAGWTAYADLNDNGKADVGEPSAVSGADGTYAISGLAAGHYARVREDRQDGWARTKPAGTYPQGYYDVTVNAGQAATAKDFGNYKASPAPPTARDDAAVTDQDKPVTVDVLANDADDFGLAPATVAVATAPAHGTATVDPATGRVTYAPAAGFVGADAFAYTVADVEGATSAAARVDLAVTAKTLAVSMAGRLPAAAVGGTKMKMSQVVTVTNMTDRPFSGPVTVKVVASADHAMGPDDPTVALAMKRLKLKPHASRKIKVSIRGFPATLPDGSYCLMSQATGPAGTSNAAESASEVRVAAPFVDLAAAFAAPPPAALVAGRKATVRLAVGNRGNIPARGRVAVALYASADGSTTGATPLATVSVKVDLKPGRGKAYKLRFAVPAGLPAAPAYVVAVVDPDHRLADRDWANNTAATAGPVPVG